MKLLTKRIKQNLPLLYSQDGNKNARVIVKFFAPDSNWTWYVIEAATMIGDRGYQVWEAESTGHIGDILFFGLVEGLEREMGYFTLSELEKTRGPLGLAIERDIHWDPDTRLSSLLKKEYQR